MYRYCYSEYARGKNLFGPPAKFDTLICQICKKEFNRSSWYKNKQICCSIDCSKIWRKSHPTKKKTGRYFNCNCCGVEVYRQPYQFNSSGKYYCSNKCHNRQKFIDLKNGFISSKIESIVETHLKTLGIIYEPQYILETDRGIRLYDFFIPEMNTLLEVDGIYWHGKITPVEKLKPYQVRTIENDKFKTETATERGFNLVRIWEDEISETNIKTLLKLQ